MVEAVGPPAILFAVLTLIAGPFLTQQVQILTQKIVQKYKY
jgi:hypothetical protein